MEVEYMPGHVPAGDVAASGGMTLFGTIGMSSHLRPDGSVWTNDTVDWMAEPLQWRGRRAGTREALGCILVATKRVPELRALLPVKPPEAPPCPACAGGGHLTRVVRASRASGATAATVSAG